MCVTHILNFQNKQNKTNSSNTYCHGYNSCYQSVINTGMIFVSGYYGATQATLNFKKIATCEASKACYYSTVSNGDILVCEGRQSCYGSTITNVTTIIGLGYQSLTEANIIINNNNDSSSKTEIYLLGYRAGDHLIITIENDLNLDLSPNSVFIYCENNGCLNISNTLFCTNIDNSDNGDSSNVEKCTLSTFSPTRIPTNFPSIIPTKIPTGVPSTSPIYIPTITPTDIPITAEYRIPNSEYIKTWESIGIIIIIICIGLGFVFFILSSTLYDIVVIKLISGNMSARGRRKFNIPKHYRIWIFFQNIADFWTDLMSSILLYLEGFQFLSYLTSFFTILPFIVQLFVGVKFVVKWKHWKNDCPIRLTSYVKKYEILIYLLSIISGFYNTIDLLQSEIFYLKFFKFSLKSEEYNTLRPYRFINIVIFENLPQLAIQIVYLVLVTKENTIYKANAIVFISMIFSILGLLLAFIRETSRQLDNHHNKKSRKVEFGSRINASLFIKSRNLTFYHNFCHKKLGTCLQTCLNTCDDSKEWVNRDNVKYDIEVYYINDMMSTLNQIQICYEIKLSYNQFKLETFYDNLKSIGIAQSKNQEKMIKVKLYYNTIFTFECVVLVIYIFV